MWRIREEKGEIEVSIIEQQEKMWEKGKGMDGVWKKSGAGERKTWINRTEDKRRPSEERAPSR